MKTHSITALLVAVAFAHSTQAHDPSEHLKEKPKCDALEGMDLETLDRDDPVAQALIKKCMQQLHQEEQKVTHRDAAEPGHHH